MAQTTFLHLATCGKDVCSQLIRILSQLEFQNQIFGLETNLNKSAVPVFTGILCSLTAEMQDMQRHPAS